MKRRCAELPPIPEAFFMEKFNQVRNAKLDAESTQKKQWTCEISKRSFKSEGAYKHYLSSKNYMKLIEKQLRKEAALEDAVMVGNNVVDEDDEEPIQAPQPSQPKAPRPDDQPIALLYSLFSAKGPFPDVKSTLTHMLRHHGFFIPFIDYLVDVEGLLEYLGYKIGVGHSCLLCNKPFENCYAAQQHMRDKGHCMMSIHDENGNEDLDLLDFYEFPHNIDYDAMDEADDDLEQDEDDEDYEVEESTEEKLVMTDENGEVIADAEAGEVIENAPAPKMTREQRLKLRQQQRFRTMQLLGLRAAIISEETDGEPMSTALTVPVERKRQLRDMNDQGELILSDGTVVGNRLHLRTYKKRERDPNASTTVQSELMAKYYALKMPGYISQEKRKYHNDQGRQSHQGYMLRHLDAGMRQNLILRKHFRCSNTL